jgi:hypothetical protein
MSSTYSPDLRIELIGTGDQAGVWGNTTNTNLGTLIENAVAGYTSVSIVASPQALTANDGALDEARFAAIALTTSTSANFTVCIPPNSKLYTFYNASSYIATITNSTVKNGIIASGGTTVAIPAGKTMSVWSDGTNVAQQSNHLISPTIASPAMSGTPTTPTAATGTNTTQVASTAYVIATLLASVYPVGSIYTNASVSTNPGTLLGFGTWTAFGAGRVPVGFDSGNTLFDTAEETGGSYDAIAVSHTHSFSTTSGDQSQTHTHTATQDAHQHFIANTNRQDPGSFSVTLTNSNYLSGSSFAGGTQEKYSLNGDGTVAFVGLTSSAQPAISVGNASQGHTHSVSGTTGSTGSSGTNANIQPYITVYMWKRTV